MRLVSGSDGLSFARWAGCVEPGFLRVLCLCVGLLVAVGLVPSGAALGDVPHLSGYLLLRAPCGVAWLVVPVWGLPVVLRGPFGVVFLPSRVWRCAIWWLCLQVRFSSAPGWGWCGCWWCRCSYPGPAAGPSWLGVHVPPLVGVWLWACVGGRFWARALATPGGGPGSGCLRCCAAPGQSWQRGLGPVACLS